MQMQESQLRYRGQYENNTGSRYRNHQTTEIKPEPKKPISLEQLFAVFTITIVTMVLVAVIERMLPPDIKRNDPSVNVNSDKFIAYKAMDNLIELTNLGPRVSGSHQCEVQAVNFFKEKIEKIIDEAKDNHVIQMDVQKVSGAFPLTFFDGMTSVYRDLQNVVVRIGSRINSEHSLLLNCHYDTVVDSPGASDDGAACAVMLEILRAISKSNRILKHNIIFLFNGAEENIMQASHGFITQHKWAHEVRTFINLEACGAGGKEILFQVGPNDPWIMEIYAQSVPYPYATSLAQEIFESGLFPGDTDFRVFRDFGKISGLDFAWNRNGYVYHTKFDTVRQIPLGSLQRTGENIMALALGIANGYQMSKDTVLQGQPVFFDILGVFVFRIPPEFAGVLGYLALSLMIATIYLNIESAKKRFGVKPFNYLSELRTTCLVVVIAWVLAFCCCLGLAALLTALARPMSWYARPLWIYPLYVTQTICVPIVVMLLATRRKRKTIQGDWFLCQMYSDAILLMWGTLLLFCIMSRIKSGYIPFLWVICPSFFGLLRNSLGAKWKDWQRLLCYLCGIIIPFVTTYQLIIGVVYLVIPVMGRTGSALYPELVIAALVGLIFLLLLGWLSPLILCSEAPWKVVNWLTGIILVSVGLVILTPWGFPYSGDVNRPAPQRFMVANTHRTFFNKDGIVLEESSGYWIVDMDTNSPHSVDGYVPSMRSAEEIGEYECNTHLFCGMPYPIPAHSLIKRSHWLEGPMPRLPLEATVKLNSLNHINSTFIRMSFTLVGPNHIAVMISPVRGASIRRLSYTEGRKPIANPPWNHRESYFVYIASGEDAHLPWHFEIDVSHTFVKLPSYFLDMNVIGHYMHGPNKTNLHLTSLISKFPSWTAVSSWSASLIGYKF